MTDPVETLAQALAEEYFQGRLDDPTEVKTPYFWPKTSEAHKDQWRPQARALLVQIGPALVAEAGAKERRIWTEAVESYFDAAAVSAVESYAAAIRARSSDG